MPAQAFRAVELAGAGYLLYLALRGLRAHDKSASHHSNDDGGQPRIGGLRAGLISNILNPKMGLFFLAVMPQFIPSHAPVLPYALARSRAALRQVL